ncbi:MAG: glycosyltransferase family 4 protein [Rhodocyclaceae bacterium]|nr:glycosyltransferase family 4 protein [Rhodocyclaceae bacterium]
MKVILGVDPVKFPLTGIGRYTYELALGLQRASLESLLFFRGARVLQTLPALQDAQPMARQPAWKRLALRSRIAVGLYRRLQPWRQARALRGLEDHIYHGPNFYLPPFGGRCVVTIHDLSAYSWSKTHPPERVRYMQAEIELALKRAAALITDTEFTRQEVAKFFGWPLQRVHAVPLACAEAFRPRDHGELAQPLARWGLAPDGYVLFTGTVEPRKNLATLLEAFSRLPRALRMRWPLVVTGYRGWASEALHARMAAAEREGWLRYLGFVPDEALPLLMAGARLFAFPSLYEGFGLPVLEAMASGVPVVCSNAASLPEVAGSAAAFHAPEDVDGLADLLHRGLEDEAWRKAAREAGFAQAAKFSWGKCVQQTVDVYRAVESV